MRGTLLTLDGGVNLLLGVMLVWYPMSLARDLGLTTDGKPFFASIPGGVLFGVGLALIIERFRPPLRIAGLGLGGAIAINLCGGAVLGVWLSSGALPLTPIGRIVLWALVVLLIGLSTVELFTHLRSGET